MIRSNEDKQLKVAYYIRVSTEEQSNKYGKDLQRTALDAFMKSRGSLDNGADRMLLAGDSYVYIDDGISGTTELEERPAFSRLLEDIRNNIDEKPFDVIAVYKIDRFARRLKILLEAIELFNESDISFISTTETIDTSTPFGKAILGIVGVLAELEMETIKQRTEAGREEAIRRGVYMGSVPPYGYIKDTDKRLKILSEEAEIVKEIYGMFLQRGYSIGRICRELGEREILSPLHSAQKYKKNNRKIAYKKNNMYFWNSGMIKKILADEVYIGNYYYLKNKDRKTVNKEHWVKAPTRHESIIDEGSFKRVQLILKNNSKIFDQIQMNDTKYLYLLSGVLKCDACYDPTRDYKEGRQTWHGDQKKIPLAKGHYTTSYSYKCRRKHASKTDIHCNALPLPADQIETYVIERLKELLHNPQAVYKYQQELESTKKELALLKNKEKHIEKSLNAYESRIKQILFQHKEGFISDDVLKSERENERRRKENSEKELRLLKEQISDTTLSEGYLLSFKIFKEKYEKALNDITTERAELQEIIKLIIDEIVVYSRNLEGQDIVAGRKIDNQKIPYRIDIKLKLPRDYLLSMKEDIDKASYDSTILPPVKPEELSEQDLKKLEHYGITLEQYNQDYKELLEHFGDKKHIW